MVPVSAAHPTDKIAHLLLFAVLSLLWMTVGSSARRGCWASLAVWVGGTVFGIGRVCIVADRGMISRETVIPGHLRASRPSHPILTVTP